jgi:hypothetical protein
MQKIHAEKKLDEIGASVAMGLSTSLAHIATKTSACASI